MIRHRIDKDSHLSPPKIVHSLGITTSTVCHYVRNVLGMKCFHLRYVPTRSQLLRKWTEKISHKQCWRSWRRMHPRTFIFVFLATTDGFSTQIMSGSCRHYVRRTWTKFSAPQIRRGNNAHCVRLKMNAEDELAVSICLIFCPRIRR
jgi:hypothetical protein